MQLLETENRQDFMLDIRSDRYNDFAEYDPSDSQAQNRHHHLNYDSENAIIATPKNRITGSEIRSPLTAPAYVRLALEELKCFELVDYQFEHWGVTFTNVIAIQPSNPAFLIRPGATVLMGAPKSGLIEVNFKHPVNFISGLVTSSRRTVLSAYNRTGNLIADQELPAPNLAGFNSPIPPNTKLSVAGSNIYKVTFYAFDGQLVVDDFSFGVSDSIE
jgi:hypothetical protein